MVLEETMQMTTIYVFCPEVKTVLNHLESDTIKITERFPNSFMKLNEDNRHLMIFGAKRDTEIAIKIGEACIK